MGCNYINGDYVRMALELSVSCVGSNGLQPYPSPTSIPVWSTFSILCRIEWVATERDELLQAADTATFSILCRIEWVATIKTVQTACLIGNFQYPVSDRMGCNVRRGIITSTWAVDFQYPVSDRMGCNDGKVINYCLDPESFQYPVSDRMGCNYNVGKSMILDSGENG